MYLFLFRYTMSYLIRTGNSRNNISWGGGTSTKAKYLRRTGTGRTNISWIDISSNSTVNVLERTASGRNNIRWYNTNFSFIDYIYGPGDIYAEWPCNGNHSNYNIIDIRLPNWRGYLTSYLTAWYTEPYRAYSYDRQMQDSYSQSTENSPSYIFQIISRESGAGTQFRGYGFTNNSGLWINNTKGLVVSFPNNNVYIAFNVQKRSKYTDNGTGGKDNMLQVCSVGYDNGGSTVQFSCTSYRASGNLPIWSNGSNVRVVVSWYSYNVV